jgi:hypothetical protein
VCPDDRVRFGGRWRRFSDRSRSYEAMGATNLCIGACTEGVQTLSPGFRRVRKGWFLGLELPSLPNRQRVSGVSLPLSL